ncbi:hypothetical protein [Streptomyces sp. NPDC053427]|uniref:hypothetical protein n=1 Tax=Streptomyces sp. NPDC053427 TaxID=3365701 RepID=UPI0037D93826
MSHSQVAPPQGATPPTGRAAGRPGTLTALLAITVLSAVSAFVGAILVYTGGKEGAEQNILDASKAHPDLLDGGTISTIKALGPNVWDEAVSERYGTLSARAGMAVFFGLCLLVFGLCARNGATWARVLLTISAVLALFPHILIAGDYEPDPVFLTSLAAMLTAVVAVVVGWLPPNGRYAKHLKLHKQQHPGAMAGQS